MTGIVKLVAAQGYGFVIADDGSGDIYLPHSQVGGLSKGDHIEFDIEALPSNMNRAINVRKLEVKS
ncbi:MAG TPA: cold shock domain-containing protein [Candidatus Eisenbacteria bacterium]|nr:cold shock domain-containing protein [Candidatus Eisenbacteria bacterium]